MKKALLTLGLIAVGAAAIAPAGIGFRARAAEPKTADIWIVAGQSNAAGYSQLNQTVYGGSGTYRTKLTNEDGRNASGYSNVVYYGLTEIRANATLPKPQRSNVVMGQGAWGDRIGPELGMANVLSETHTPDNPAVIVKYAVGGTYLGDFGGAGEQTKDYGNWASPTMTKKATEAGKTLHANNGLLYSRLLDTLEASCADLKTRGFTPSIKGYIWMQGEADAVTSELANAYEENLTDFINDLRKDVALRAEDAEAVNRPFVIGKINSTGEYGGNIATVRAAEDKVANALNDVFTVDTDTYKIINGSEVVGSDKWHFNANDMYDLGKRFASAAISNMSKYTYYVSAAAGGTAEEKVVRSNGEAVKIHVTPARGKLVDKITLNGVELPASVYADGVITLTPEESHGSSSNINVTFRDREKQTITVKLGKGGRIGSRTPSGSTVYEGETLTVTPLPDADYEVDAVTLNGVPMTEADGKYSAVLGAGNYVLEVKFKETGSDRITLVAGKGGTATPNVRTEGAKQVLEVTPQPEAGYEVASVKINGKPMNFENGKYIAVIGDETYSLEVTFRKVGSAFPAWGIALIAVGGVLVLAGAGTGVFFGLKKAKKGSKTEADEEQPQDKQD